MEKKESAVEEIKSALSHAPRELYASIVFEACRVNVASIDHNCSRLAAEDDLLQIPDKRQKIIDDIYFDLDEIRRILWTAVIVSKSDDFSKNSDLEG